MRDLSSSTWVIPRFLGKRIIKGNIADPSSLQINQIKLELENNFIKGEFTRPTLSGMIRSEIFFRKFQKSYLI